jgi:ABC-2 type transport system ATP-binding protein
MIVAELRNVTKRFGSITALSGVNLAIKRGQVLALLGPNGAGKTTAVRLLLGLSSPHSGEARVFGRDAHEIEARRRVGVMLQLGRVPETLRVREHIELFSSYYPNPMPLEDAVEIAGLRGLERRMFSKLSGGQRQRVLFALAICGRPELLVLDEPTASLDVESRRGLWSNIRAFVAAGGSVLLTTHYLEEADALADEIVVLNKGKVVAAGPPHEIKGRAATRRVRCKTALTRHEVENLPGVNTVRVDGASMEILAANPENIVRILLNHDPELSGLEVTGAALEDAFLALTEPAHEQPMEVLA